MFFCVRAAIACVYDRTHESVDITSNLFFFTVEGDFFLEESHDFGLNCLTFNPCCLWLNFQPFFSVDGMRIELDIADKMKQIYIYLARKYTKAIHSTDTCSLNQLDVSYVFSYWERNCRRCWFFFVFVGINKFQIGLPKKLIQTRAFFMSLLVFLSDRGWIFIKERDKSDEIQNNNCLHWFSDWLTTAIRFMFSKILFIEKSWNTKFNELSTICAIVIDWYTCKIDK